MLLWYVVLSDVPLCLILSLCSSYVVRVGVFRSGCFATGRRLG